MKLHYNGKITDKGLIIYNRPEFEKDINLFFGKEISLTLEQRKRKRSLSQNSYYWSVVVKIVREGLIDAGYKVSVSETHELLKYKFLKSDIVNEDGEVLETIKSTTELSTSDMMDYIAQIQQWASEYLNVYVPDANEQLQIEI